MIYWPARKWKSPRFYVRNLVTTTKLMLFACAEPIKHIKHVLSVLHGLVYGKKDESPRQYLYYFHINSSEVCGLPKNEEVKRIFSPNIVSLSKKVIYNTFSEQSDYKTLFQIIPRTNASGRSRPNQDPDRDSSIFRLQLKVWWKRTKRWLPLF